MGQTIVRLGKTGILSPKNAFGALPIQRADREEAVRILRKAFRAGFTHFDTARAYSDSESKLGEALGDVRDAITISTKTMARTPEEFRSDLAESLSALGTGHVDIHQFHNPPFVPRPGDGSGLYEAMEKARDDGAVLHIGITSHRVDLAEEAVESGLYECLQYPFSYLASQREQDLARLAAARDVGFIAMKSLAGGLITNPAAAYAFAAQFENVLPIWGIQREHELDDFIGFFDSPPSVDGEISDVIENDRRELAGDFCRGCGYCMPCTVGIRINDMARMSLMIRRAPSERFFDRETILEMRKIRDCAECGSCAGKCPYGLDTPALLRKNLEDYEAVLAGLEKI